METAPTIPKGAAMRCGNAVLSEPQRAMGFAMVQLMLSTPKADDAAARLMTLKILFGDLNHRIIFQNGPAFLDSFTRFVMLWLDVSSSASHQRRHTGRRTAAHGEKSMR